MKKIIVSSLLAISAFLPLQAIEIDEITSLIQKEIEGRTFLNYSSHHQTETYVVRYETVCGYLVHVGIWTDCIVCTVISDGMDTGLQVITLLDGTRFDSSRDYKKKSDHFTHKYSWGEVVSYDGKQILKRK